ncbi:ubiquinone biosynthesis protein COQ4 homolog, mitochondrial isoform X2 [Daktulosphaira vitifoliae]|uniref:ubiquinone biosynthesis protein COQ4 homolog, mitochondrial isoform X2 n=1 Tax=Daktulosphaira vitifoliae TaxID=58002 RepID=UPI0021AA5F1C|nr:ubiquinone biosynthesis protein COQ4 homolog, mitochondrial isoform X2 [Daktulosphaira vitifoliae]
MWKKIVKNTPYSRYMSDFANQYKKNHISTTPIQKMLLAVGSATISLFDPCRADMIATFGETTGMCALQDIKRKMSNNPEGIEILQSQPRINSSTIDLNKLQNMPKNSLGFTYYKFLDDNKVTPDSRGYVQFIDDVELAYVMQRYREVHDLFHTILGMPTNMLGEVTVKWVEAFQTKLPMTMSGGLFGAVRLKSKQREQYMNYYLPWAIKTGINSKFMLNIYFEKRWEQSIEDLQKELNIRPLEFN